MSRKILNSIQAENIQQAFASKYKLDENRGGELSERQQYFGQLLSDEFTTLYSVVNHQQDKLDYFDGQEFGFTIYPLLNYAIQIKRLVTYTVVAIVTVTDHFECPLTSKRMVRQHSYFLTEKMWDEVVKITEA
jgi:hypothetical protein